MEFTTPLESKANSNADLAGTSLRGSAIAQGAYLHPCGRRHAGLGHWSQHRSVYASRPGAVAIAAGLASRATGAAAIYRLDARPLQLFRGRRSRLLFLSDVPRPTRPEQRLREPDCQRPAKRERAMEQPA